MFLNSGVFIAYSPAGGPITIASMRWPGTEQDLVDLLGLRQRMSVGRDDVERHPLNLQREEQRRADIGDPPELHLARPDVDQRIELAVDGDDLAAAAGFGVLDQEKPLRQSGDDRKLRVRALDHERAGHAAEHLLGDEAVPVRMVPIEARLLPAGARDRHLVVEFVSRVADG